MADAKISYWSLIDGEGRRVPGASLDPWEWRQPRGAEPHIATITCPDKRFSGLKNPVKLEFAAPNKAQTQWARVTYERLFIVSDQDGGHGVRVVKIADIRWLLLRGALNASYNIVSYDGEYRPDSVENDSAWAVAEAVADALRKVIDSLDASDKAHFPSTQPVHINSSDDRLRGELAPNLGNSRGGGWEAAKITEWLPVMLGEAGDLVVTHQGQLWIVDRGSGYLPEGGILKHGHMYGDLAPKHTQWQLPRAVIVHFGQRVGTRFDVAQADGTYLISDTTTSQQFSPLVVENVVPAWSDDPDEPPEWQTFAEWYTASPVSAFGLSDAVVRELYHRPHMIDIDSLGAAERTQALRAENMVRKYWRRAWRIVDDDLRRKFADVRLGRLRSDGTTDEAVVLCDHVVLYRWADQDGALSENIEYPAESPFVARWPSAAGREALVWMMALDENRPSIETVYPGHWTEDAVFPPLDQIEEEGELAFECLRAYEESIRLAVHYHALYVCTDDPSYPRTYQVEVAIPGSGAGTVHTHATGLTANYKVTDASSGERELLNETELQTRATEIAMQIRKSYEQGRAGMMTFSGLDVIARWLRPTALHAPAGDLYDIIVQVGTPAKLYELRTILDVRPESRPLRLKPQVSEEPAHII